MDDVRSKLIIVSRFLSSACGNSLRLKNQDVNLAHEIDAKNCIQITKKEIIQMN
jgi:hypothetical protein